VNCAADDAILSLVKVAVYQAPLLPIGSLEALEFIREQVAWCEAQDISILCCPEAILGGLADFSAEPNRIAIRATDGALDRVLTPLKSTAVTTIIGFTELAPDGNLYNSAAVLHHEQLAGIYRKHHPARRESVYSSGSEPAVFEAGRLKFGVIICNDSNYAEPARQMAMRGATVLFVPSNNALPAERAFPKIVQETRAADQARAIENDVWMLRADVAGRFSDLVAYGSSGVVNPAGKILLEARAGCTDLLVADLAAPVAPE
jgi:predicted amidohydrolase